MKWLLLLAILIVALLIFALYRRVQPGANTHRSRHPVTDGTTTASTAPPAADAAPAAEEGWDEAAAPPEVPVEVLPPDGGDAAVPSASSASEAWAETPATDEHSTEVQNAESLASSGTLESEIAELEGERQAPNEPRD